MPDVSVIVCTHNRAVDLEKTLQAIDEVSIPTGWEVELTVVDNGSTDRTQLVVRQAKIRNVLVRSLYEPREGLSVARNTGMAGSSGLPSPDVPEGLMVASLLRSMFGPDTRANDTGEIEQIVGPEPSQRMSLAIFISEQARVFNAPLAMTRAS